MILLTISLCFLLLYALLIFYYWRWWNKLPVYSGSDSDQQRFISVIVPARNEEKNIKTLLQHLAGQSYLKNFFEVIVVDDFSSDGTAEIVKTFPLVNLSLLNPSTSPEFSSKKRSIETGIEKAKGELIVTTDADCIPPKNWLSSINSFYVERKAMFIAAPVKFTHNGTFLQRFQALDFLVLQGITAASVAANFHTMCNGANLAYPKQAFFSVSGFEGIDKVATGDDLLLMHKIWKKHPDSVYFLKSEDAIMTTQPMPDWKSFFMQRKRWASKTLVYDDFRIIAVLGFVFLVNCLFVALVAASVFNSFHWWLVLGFWIAKTLIELPFVSSVAKFYKQTSLVKFLFVFQPLHIFYTVIVGLLSQFGKYEWKGRKTK
jgi:biofilm PGA synthesis N-glycosyltransferase PgaC